MASQKSKKGIETDIRRRMEREVDKFVKYSKLPKNNLSRKVMRDCQREIRKLTKQLEYVTDMSNT